MISATVVTVDACHAFAILAQWARAIACLFDPFVVDASAGFVVVATNNFAFVTNLVFAGRFATDTDLTSLAIACAPGLVDATFDLTIGRASRRAFGAKLHRGFASQRRLIAKLTY